MPNKPNKFGIKFWLAFDGKSKYIVIRRESSVPLGESNNGTQTIYKAKPNKKIPILEYHKSSTKFDVRTDQMARKYCIKSKSQRWSLQIIFSILDLAETNAWILYKETGEAISRQEFLSFQLREELAIEYQEE
ncbi:unnamed protein product [Heterotrigona itama]|uniref:PiggyBac transposable element-derived protein domain-containing protein n=1 Tax=Heterotrigona itama TaxID=395501 RepID=A0A6V7HJH3_9HYME|nr:unnamed protein product [Heterotrigona itama]